MTPEWTVRLDPADGATKPATTLASGGAPLRAAQPDAPPSVFFPRLNAEMAETAFIVVFAGRTRVTSL